VTGGWGLGTRGWGVGKLRVMNSELLIAYCLLPTAYRSSLVPSPESPIPNRLYRHVF